jgi:hypothetical protein
MEDTRNTILNHAPDCEREEFSNPLPVPGLPLDAYLDEWEHRFSDNQFLFRDMLLKLVTAEKLSYAKLTKAA